MPQSNTKTITKTSQAVIPVTLISISVVCLGVIGGLFSALLGIRASGEFQRLVFSDTLGCGYYQAGPCVSGVTQADASQQGYPGWQQGSCSQLAFCNANSDWYTVAVSGGYGEQSSPTVPAQQLVNDIKSLRAGNQAAAVGLAAITSATPYYKWQPAVFDFINYDAPEGLCSTSEFNPFLNYRLDVVFSKAGYSVTVPGAYAGSGGAAETPDGGTECGRTWRVYFTPEDIGTWTYEARFYEGDRIAVSDNPGTPRRTEQGSFVVTNPIAKTDKDLSAKGILRHSDGRYLQFSGGEYMLKFGMNSPEVFLGYSEFDNTPNATYRTNIERYETIDMNAHTSHFNDTGIAQFWKGRGRNIFGAIDYLAARDMNVIYMLTLSAAGDSENVFPWMNSDFKNLQPRQLLTDRAGLVNDVFRYDVSKLDQWNRVFDYMNRRGLIAELVLSEEENERLLGDDSYSASTGLNVAMSDARKLYLREMIARFGHHNGLIWNIGEEHGAENAWKCKSISDDDRKSIIDYINALDPYDHPITMHTNPIDISHEWPQEHQYLCPPSQRDPATEPAIKRYEALYGHPGFNGASTQIDEANNTFTWVKRLIDQARDNTGRPWLIFVDEFLNNNNGIYGSGNVDIGRKQVLWPSLMAGAAGVEWYYGQKGGDQGYDQRDVNWADGPVADILRYTKHARDFFVNNNIPYWEMGNTSRRGNNYMLSKGSDIFVVYRSGSNVAATIDYIDPGQYTVQWYDPRNGGALQNGSVVSFTVTDTASQYNFGNPPRDSNQDWVVLIRKSTAPICGNGSTQAGEECDDGNTNSGDGCSVSCKVERCGNGRIDYGEACDGGPHCSVSCQLTNTTPTLIAYDFERDNNQWEAGNVPGIFDTLNHQRVSGPGRLTSGLQNQSSNAFGWWGSQPVQINDQQTSQLYKVQYRLLSNKNSSAAAEVPGFRLRVSDPSFNQSSVIVGERLGSRTVVPLQEGRIYTQYVYMPFNTLRAYVDTTSFTGQPTPAGSTIMIDWVSVEPVSFGTLGTQRPVRTFTLTGSGAAAERNSWASTTIPHPDFSGTQFATNDQGLAIRGVAVNTPLLYGSWEKPNAFDMFPGKTYRLIYTVSSNGTNALTMPSFRLRVNAIDPANSANSWQFAAVNHYESVTAQSVIPINNQEKQYELIFTLPANMPAQKALVTLDYLWVQGTGDIATSINYTLKKVEVYEY